MTLVRDGLLGFIVGVEEEPEAAADRAKYLAKKNRALATIVLAVDPSLLYLIGDEPSEPADVWKKLQDHHKKTWANKLALRRKLHSLRLKEGESVQNHIKTMIELFNELSLVGDKINEDRVVYLLASLPDLFNTLVIALEANEEVPKMNVVTERLLYTERKQKDRTSDVSRDDKILATKSRGPKCFHCKKFGHIQRNCPDRTKTERRGAETRSRSRFKKDEILVTTLKAKVHTHDWIVDSGGTSHICNSKELFDEFELLPQPDKVALGDGRMVEAVGSRTVCVKLKLPDGKYKTGRITDVLYVPCLEYKLLSIAKVTEAGKKVIFEKTQGQFCNNEGKVIAVASRTGNLYYLNCEPLYNRKANAAVTQTQENLWHRRFGHLNERSLGILVKAKLVKDFNYDVSKQIQFCESCVSGKIYRSPFPSGQERASELLELVHSDVCGKMSTPSEGQAEYFLILIDDKTHFVWVYLLKKKHEVFQKFVEWKIFVEKSSGHKVGRFRSDNGGEYTSTEFETYLKKEGIAHEYTMAKSPEQNGVSERMNRTLVEKVRSMLADSKLPHKFWAEALMTAAYLIKSVL